MTKRAKTPMVGFNTPSADLHKKSRWIFLGSLFLSIIITAVVLHISLPERKLFSKNVEAPPVIIQLENIPQTRHIIRTPAPVLPSVLDGMPIGVEDELLPDDITIDDTKLELEAIPPSPPSLIVQDDGVEAVEEEIYEYFAVEEQPRRTNTIVPVYPEMAKRAGIEGTVLMKVLVNKEGLVDSVEVINGPEIFNESAKDAAMASSFTPAKQNDKPVICWVFMPFRFILEK
ncbi:energy transducer TonB [Candidatus Latescibacterota bacterium]